MGTKIKALGLGVLATLAIGAMASIDASATVTGHFTHDAVGGHAILTGTEGPANHRVKFSIDNGTHFECDATHYHGTVSTATFTTFQLTPTYSGCHTEGGVPGSITIDANNCHLKFYSNTGASTPTPTEHATFDYLCPAGTGVVITHPNCTIKMPTQPLKGITYTTVTENSKHALTVDMTVQGKTVHYESGICVFLGTTHTGATTGSFTLKALNTPAEQVSLTAT